MTMSDGVTRIECITDGRFEHSAILVNGNRLTPERSVAVRNHSPGGFSWGYEGSGPAQLALAILLECNISEEEALRVYQDFKRQFIAIQPQDKGWVLDVDVHVWVGIRMAEMGEL